MLIYYSSPRLWEILKYKLIEPSFTLITRSLSIQKGKKNQNINAASMSETSCLCSLEVVHHETQKLEDLVA
jgi:hypothetical protein